MAYFFLYLYLIYTDSKANISYSAAAAALGPCSDLCSLSLHDAVFKNILMIFA